MILKENKKNRKMFIVADLVSLIYEFQYLYLHSILSINLIIFHPTALVTLIKWRIVFVMEVLDYQGWS